MAVPAGYSSEEDFNDDDFSFPVENHSIPSRNIDSNHFFLPLGQRLLVALIEGNNEEAILLIKDGADVNFKTKQNGGWTALMHACYRGSKDLISLLLEYGANVNDHYELVTPLMCLCDCSCASEDVLLECLELLVQKNANINAADCCNVCVLSYAVKSNHEKIVLKLINLTCDVDIADSSGWTPLFYAVDTGRLNLVKILKNAGADVSKLDVKGRSVYELALSKFYPEIAEIVDPHEKDELEDFFESFNECLKGNSYTKVLKELPDCSFGRFHGFQSDVIAWIHGIHLSHLCKFFFHNNVQLGELLTMKEQDLKNVGVTFSFDRKKILFCIQRFLEHNWSKNSIRGPRTNEDVTLVLAAQIISNMVRHVHIIGIATHLWKINNKPNITQTCKALINDGLLHMKLFRKELRTIFRVVTEIEKEEDQTPPDYIFPKARKLPFFRWIWLSFPLGFMCFKFAQSFLIRFH